MTNNNSLRLPSVTTWTQSFVSVVMGHFQRAPERFVPGCKFSSNGAPTSNLKLQQKRKKKIEKKRGELTSISRCGSRIRR